MNTYRATLLLAAAALSPALPLSAQTAASARPAITAIAYAKVDAADPAASDAFYRSLGYTGVKSGENTIYAVDGSQYIETVPHAAPATGKASSRLAEVGFLTSDVVKLEHLLRVSKVPIVEPLHEGRFVALDPEGNRVGFVQTGSFHETAAQRAQAGRAPSHRMIHVGFTVHDEAAENRFYRTLLGFKPYWYGGMKDGAHNFTSLQVPDGTDWLEYMELDGPPNPDPTQQQRQFGVSDHFSLGVEHMTDVVAALKADGCVGKDCSTTQMGRDGKVQLNVYDPDGTRIEYMEFKPTGPICCSAFTGPHPESAREP